MDWSWIADNWGAIVTISTIAIVGAAWLLARYRGNQERLLRDLDELLRNALEYLKDWAGDELDGVTENDVAVRADWLYDRYVVGGALEQFVTRETFRALLWAAFTRWRDLFIAANYAEAKGLMMRR